MSYICNYTWCSIKCVNSSLLAASVVYVLDESTLGSSTWAWCVTGTPGQVSGFAPAGPADVKRVWRRLARVMPAAVCTVLDPWGSRWHSWSSRTQKRWRWVVTWPLGKAAETTPFMDEFWCTENVSVQVFSIYLETFRWWVKYTVGTDWFFHLKSHRMSIQQHYNYIYQFYHNVLQMAALMQHVPSQFDSFSYQ